MAGWFSRRQNGPGPDAADPRMPVGVFKLCGCGQRVIPSWDTQCSSCRSGGLQPTPVQAAPPPPAPFVPPPPSIPTAGARPQATPRPTAFHALGDLPPERPAQPPRPPPTTQKTVKLDLSALGDTAPPEPMRAMPAPPPPPPPTAFRGPVATMGSSPAPVSAPQKTMAFALPPAPVAPLAAAAPTYSLAFDPPAEGESEGWTLQGTGTDGEVVTLHLRWNGEAWMLLDGIGNPATAALLRPLGLVVRGAGA